MSDLTEAQIEKQEDLSNKRLALLKPEIIWGSVPERPTHNLIDLMHWVRQNFAVDSGAPDALEHGCFIHNKIVIDGSFLEFCDQKGVKIKTLYLDSVASWRSDHDSEHFMAQGVFKIIYKNLEFIHAALFHKGNQNEDEVSFFIVVKNSLFHDYVKFRNEFDKWLVARDREHLEIHVVGGEGQPYSRNVKWDDLFLPQELKDDIRGSIEGWLNAKGIYEKAKIPWKRGILLYGAPGCHALGTGILMHDGSIKKVEDVSIGDYLMGPDSEPREVLKLVRGYEEMYRITPKKGKPFIVNKNHILHLVPSGKIGYPDIDISVDNLMSCSAVFKERFKLKYADAVEFSSLKSNLPIDPYFLGLWLGDGNSANSAITTADKEIEKCIYKEAKKRKLKVRETKKTDSICKTYYIHGNVITNLVDAKKHINSLQKDLISLNLINNKHIPNNYLIASIEDRLQLLAGIIDTDGHYIGWRQSSKYKNKGTNKTFFEVSQKSKILSDQIVFLAKSLGFGVTVKEVTKTIKSINFSGQYYRINIFGSVDRIPTKLLRKQSCKGKSNKDTLRTGILKIESIGNGDYYGFTVDRVARNRYFASQQNHLYLTDDFMIHHNCGKTTTIRTIIANYDFKPVTVHTSQQTNDDTITEAFEYAQEQSPGLLYIEDLDTLLGTTVSYSHFLNLMDGVSAKNGLMVVATANDISKLKEAVTDRPSRFDRKWEIPAPDKVMAAKYMKHWFGNTIKSDELAKHAVNSNFSYAYFKELYLTSMFHAIADGRKKPNIEDIKKSIKQLLHDKKLAKDFFEHTDHSANHIGIE